MDFLEAVDVHTDALKRAALAAGPAAPVRNCPKWTVHDLVRHLAWVHAFAVATAMNREPDATPPEDWEDLLGWWDGQRLAAREALSRPPETPARSPFPGFEITVGDWARRMAHEAAVHRLDAESALDPVPATRLSPAFTLDGIDEYATFLVPRRSPRYPVATTVHLTAAGRTWALRLTPGEHARAGEPGVPDVELSGDPDDVYRALWGRPNSATVVGDPALLAPLAAP
ncbi:maleylpyruvate isomerase family mycothiol-dependent enzyme [Amycolatopsis rifamycinica]|uniref:maleylpyruvate isomerase family mycothiol-dependent enzyme n=1 Tax=Amycolatopsis rifamycinica TaxID=287986 RepID=UPI0009FEBC90|nr:maleylpyruvate isomerase family mycothiol-dependent enzyme [Amycolatopsis rifamycinica]